MIKNVYIYNASKVLLNSQLLMHFEMQFSFFLRSEKVTDVKIRAFIHLSIHNLSLVASLKSLPP